MIFRRKAAAAPDESQTIALRDGRRIGYAEYGDARGAPALYFHGTPGSRIEARFLDEAARRAGVRLIGIDRPGYGLSGFVRGRRFLDWPDDVAQVADALGIGRFAIVALSGGGPHAAACALRMPGRLTAVALAGSAAPIEALVRIRRGRMRRWLARGGARLTVWFAALLAAHLAFWTPRISQAFMPRGIDRRVLASAEAREQFRQDAIEAFRHGSRGAAHEFRMHARPWGFAPDAVRLRIHLWHGEADTIVPVAAARLLADAFPDCRATFTPGAGHLMLFEIAEDVLRVAAPASAAAR